MGMPGMGMPGMGGGHSLQPSRSDGKELPLWGHDGKCVCPVRACRCAWVRVCVCVCVYLKSVCARACACVCVYLWASRCGECACARV